MVNYVIAHVPHSSTELPFPEQYSGDVSTELAIVTDWGTDRMADADESIIFPYSRLWCDVERFIDDPLNTRGLGMFTTHRLNGEVLREAKEPYVATAKSHYLDHHNKIVHAINNTISFMPVCLLDMHSYSNLQANLSGHLEPYPDICLGYGNVPEGLIKAISRLFKDAGYSVGDNHPYEGALVPPIYDGNPDFFAIMLEINKSTYLDDNKLVPNQFKKLQDVIDKVVEKIREW